jgi:hypothetical protein
MQVLLDDTLLMGIYDNVAEAITAGRAQAEQQGRVIVDVVLDGTAVDENELEKVCAGEIDAEPEEVRLHTADPLELTTVVLQQAEETLQQAVRLQGEVGELLQTGEQEEAMQKLTTPMELWGQVYQAVVQSALLLNIDFGKLEVGGESADRIVTGLAEQLRQVRDALVNEDQVALADELSYELSDTAGRWEGLIRVLSDEIAAAGRER